MAVLVFATTPEVLESERASCEWTPDQIRSEVRRALERAAVDEVRVVGIDVTESQIRAEMLGPEVLQSAPRKWEEDVEVTYAVNRMTGDLIIENIKLRSGYANRCVETDE